MLTDIVKTDLDKLNLRKSQREAVEAIVDAVSHNQRRIIVDMSPGSGKTAVTQAIACLVHDSNESILLLTDGKEVLQQLKWALDDANVSYSTFQTRGEQQRIVLATQQMISNQTDLLISRKFNYILLDGINLSLSSRYVEALSLTDATVIVFTSKVHSKKTHWLNNLEPVYSSTRDLPLYTEKDAFAFLIDLFRFRGICDITEEPIISSGKQNYRPDIVLGTENNVVVVEVKLYRSLSISNSFLDQAAEQLVKYKTALTTQKNEKDRAITLCLVVFCSVDEARKRQLFSRYGISILDVGNLLYLSGGNSRLLSTLMQLLPYPVDNIPYIEPTGILKTIIGCIDAESDDKEDCEAEEYIRELGMCKVGKTIKAAQIYEDLCTKIIKYLFAPEFSRMSGQHKTSDDLFRMDLLCALKGTTAFWNFLIRHYDSKFVVFEFKNYSDRIPQNVIYITEKYLFDSALRNVAFIVSRKGFNKGAVNAALGCLKEHKKLIVDLNDDDMIKMLEKKKAGEDPSDYLLSKVEDYLMSIGK